MEGVERHYLCEFEIHPSPLRTRKYPPLTVGVSLDRFVGRGRRKLKAQDYKLCKTGIGTNFLMPI